MVTVTGMGNLILSQVEEYNHRFIDEAIREWDKLEGGVVCFPVFIKGYVKGRWEEMVGKN